MKQVGGFSIKELKKVKGKKTISLSVLPDCNLKISVPYGVSMSDVERVIIMHKNWIEKRQKFYTDNKFEQKKFEEGELFLVLGKKYRLSFDTFNKIPKIIGEKLYVQKNDNIQLQRSLEMWYRQLCFEYISQKAQFFSSKMQLKYKKIKIGKAQKRWGSCSSTGNLNFTWRLIMAPAEVVDYVIVHEIAHLQEHNHSVRFWSLVGRYCPDYKVHTEWLRVNGHLLSF